MNVFTTFNFVCLFLHLSFFACYLAVSSEQVESMLKLILSVSATAAGNRRVEESAEGGVGGRV